MTERADSDDLAAGSAGPGRPHGRHPLGRWGIIALIAAIMAAVAAGAYGAQRVSEESSASVRVTKACRYWPGAGDEPPADGAVIARTLLTPETDELLLDESELAAMTSDLDRVLGLIRSRYPDMKQIHTLENFVPGEVVVGLEPDLADAVNELLAGDGDTVEFATGNRAFDFLNSQLGLRGVDLVPHIGVLLLCLDDLVNVPAASTAYSALRGIRHASPNGLMGGGPGIRARNKDGVWYVVFRDAWGDCPAGCIYEKLFLFAVSGDQVTHVHASEGAVDPVFSELLPLVGARSPAAIQ